MNLSYSNPQPKTKSIVFVLSIFAALWMITWIANILLFAPAHNSLAPQWVPVGQAEMLARIEIPNPKPVATPPAAQLQTTPEPSRAVMARANPIPAPQPVPTPPANQ